MATISGQITLSGTGIDGAVVFLIDDTNDVLYSTATTDFSGNYSFDVSDSYTYHVAVQYDDGSTKYNAKSYPYITPPKSVDLEVSSYTAPALDTVDFALQPIPVVIQLPPAYVAATHKVIATDPYIEPVPLATVSASAYSNKAKADVDVPKLIVSSSNLQINKLLSIDAPLLQLGLIGRRPRFTWYTRSYKIKNIYKFVLTGSADSKTDITIPVSSCQMRCRDGKPTYMSVVVPGYDEYVDEIIARPNSQMVLYKGVEFSDGKQQVEEINRVDLEDIRLDKGSKNRSITLSGHRIVTNEDPITVIIAGVSYRNVGDDGLRRYRADVDLWLTPGDIINVDNEGSFEQFKVDFISYEIGPKLQRMEVREAE